MAALNQILSQDGGEYLLRHGERLVGVQQKAYGNVAACRTPEMGSHLFSCEDCGHPVRTNRSCGNRHCPTCQGDKAEEWLESHFLQLLPVPYFLLTFTLPAQCREVAYGHQKQVYKAMFFAASQSVKKLAEDARYLGATQIGGLAVLHTWGRQMQYHVHLHMLMPGGGLDCQGQWRSSRQDFFLPVMALSKIYRAKFRDAMKRQGLYENFPALTWQEPFNIHCQNVGNGVRALSYLSSYLFRVAISNRRIVRHSPETVTFRYQKVGSKQWKNLTLATKEFIHRFLMHVLPRGFMKVRYFGLWSHNAAVSLEEVKRRIAQAWEVVCRLPKKLPKRKVRVFLCPKCQGKMKLAEIHRPGAKTVCLSG
jgi:hypothetical protein